MATPPCTTAHPASFRIRAQGPDTGGLPLELGPGVRLGLAGSNTYRKHFFCDWLLGFVEVPGSKVQHELWTEKNRSQVLQIGAERTRLISVLGRSPVLAGETIQESLLYRTQDVRKQELYSLIERLYGPTLRARTNPLNPLFDPKGEPIPTHSLTAREHLEVAQINVLLQRASIVVLDLASELMVEAQNEGFVLAPELFHESRALIVLLPSNKSVLWTQNVLPVSLSATLEFN